MTNWKDGCKCSFHHRMVGDGCMVCNKEHWEELLEEQEEAAQETILSEEDFIGYTTGCCKACGADVAKYVCNDVLISARREGYLEDYWASCVNANCEHHYGEGFGQQRLDWITIEED